MRRAYDRPSWPVAACALLLVCARAYAATDQTSSGICSSMDIRNNPEQILRLQGCKVIEGQLRIVLMERVPVNVFQNISFPELREVTDHIVMYRTKGVVNLGDLFPNLTVIRGMKLFKDFALVIFDNENLEALGLRSLVRIERGGVRIQQNDNLCYTNTIDWARITADPTNNVIRLNYDTRLCGLCPNAQSRMKDHRQLNRQCPADAHGRLLCWDAKHCQKICPRSCDETSGCMDNGECCHKNCLGGCTGPTARDCHVCRGYSFKDGAERVCTETCPAGTYKLSRRCVTQQVCRATPPPAAQDGERSPPKINAYKIYQNLCVYQCPTGTMEVGSASDSTCEPCDSTGCVKECSGGKVDSLEAADLYRGCTHINGKLEISSIRASGANVLKMLEDALGEIREINGALQVSRAYQLVSLMFLKNLKRINGVAGNGNKNQVLLVNKNPNLELLWDWETHGPINITGGTLFINFNPKLCYNQILPLMNMTYPPRSDFSESEVSQESNGDQASCMQEKLNLTVSQLRSTAVVLSWSVYCPEDIRRLLGFSVYYIATEQNITLYGQRDACFDTWNVLDLTKDEARNGSRDDQQITNQADILDRVCRQAQPSFYLVSHLTPYTRYAAYVKTYTTLQEKKGAQSPIVYFRTLPGKPSPPLSFTVDSMSATSVDIKWLPPAMPNGTIILYHVEVQANSYNKPKILSGNTNYCSNPNTLVNTINARAEDPPPSVSEASTGDVGNGSCACKPEPDDVKPGVRFTLRTEEERMETINFENELQNQVYKKSDKPKVKISPAKRMKRSVDHSLSSMLVKLTKNISPQPNLNYTNSTDEEGYVKSMYYELGGEARSLTVTGMRHFTWYTVSIWACRALHLNESMEDYNDTWCSERAFSTFRTSELLNADVVGNVQAELVPSNKTLPEVNVTWEPPRNPNGFVVAYNVHYSRVEDNVQGLDVGLQSCITAGDEESASRSYPLRNMQPGNYSIKITPITVAGAGNVSSEVFIYIPERTNGGGYGWAWGVAGGGAVLAGMLAAAAWYLRRGMLHGAEANKLFANVNPEYESAVYVPDEWEVPRTSIEFVRELGQGSFGMVYEGIGKNIEKGKSETRCAVKTVNEHATDRERHEFLNEASVMKAFDTFHVVRLLGVVSRGQPTLVIMELMQCGDLKTYLRSHRPDADTDPPRKGPPVTPPTLQNILQMAIEIADGMAYLSAKKFVHRDLAARNCMVAGDLTVKVGDFGMTRDIYETDYYRKGTKGLLPVRWMSPESLKDGVFSSNSDVWSYGVVLWEMATLAMQPYQGLSNEQVVRYVVEGGVMERPEHCPDRLYELMRQCWAHRPAQRPAFLHLAADLAPTAMPHFRPRSFFHSPLGQELYKLQRAAREEEQEAGEVSVGAVATASGDLFGVSGRLASWVRELSSLRSRASDDAAAEPLQPLRARRDNKPAPNGVAPPAPC